MSDFTKLLSKARIDLLSRESMVFFTSIILSVRHYVNNNIPTAATNGLEVMYNEEFFTKLTLPERVFLIAHEAMHIVLNHCTTRSAGLDPKRWNHAGDYVINLMLTDAGLKMPEGGLLDNKYRNMTTLQVYRLLEEQEGKGKGSGAGGTMSGSPLDDLIETTNSEKKEEIQKEVENIVTRAKVEAEMAGKMPGKLSPDLQRLLDRLTNPVIPWQRLLQRFFTAVNKNDYSMRTPNRRYMPLDMYLPTLHSPHMGPVDFGIDTSGSITNKIFSYFMSEVHHVLKRFKPEHVRVMQFDHCLQGNDIVKNTKQLLSLKLKGGGGTDVTEVISEFAKNKSQCLFVLTDGYVHTSHLPDPRKPVIWCVYGERTFSPPFGQVVYFDLEVA